jgi:tRNA(Ile)-lysidine synthase TilS/MesJ
MPFEEIVAVHVDYGNRDESGAEAAYVEGWCAEHGVTCVTRVISEVRRGVTARYTAVVVAAAIGSAPRLSALCRDDYERIARELRYHTYREVLSGCVGAGMLFGHHRGDLQENVVSNVMRGCSPLALSGE